jgi:signal transduction histidine kinase
MLRYQTFSYRGLALNALMILLVSATLTQVYAVFIAPRGWDGVQFATVWGAVLLTTLFWFVDSPVRRVFRRLFVRHEFDFQIAERFSQQMAAATGVDDTLTRAARFLCDNLELAWVALSSHHRGQQLWLALADQPTSLPLKLVEDSPDSHLPGTPAEALPITNGDQPIGSIWLGPRTTAEPIDTKDRQLVTLLGQELTRTLAVHAQIEDLEQVPGRILTAVEADRNRIGQDLHDSVLQFLGAVPLELDRASQLVDRDPTQAQAILDRTITQAEIIAQETRASVYDLSPPILLRQGVIEAAHVFAAQACTSHHVQLAWHVNTEAAPAWQRLPEVQAIQVYRILQQAVDNALTHANPKTLTVQFDQIGRELLAEVIDDGDGLATSIVTSSSPARSDSPGLGLISMQARARALAGSLKLTSNSGRGTTVTLRFPYR